MKHYWLFITVLILATNCRKPSEPTKRDLVNVIFRDTVFYDTEPVERRLLAYNVPDGVDVSYSDNIQIGEGVKDAVAIFTLINEKDYWDFFYIRDYYNIKSGEEVLALENDVLKTDPRWRESIIHRAKLTVINSPAPSNPKDFKIVTIQDPKTGKSVNEISEYNGKEKQIVIPHQIEGLAVDGIGVGVFKLSDITSVVLPPTLTYIGKDAFRGCKELSEVKFSEGLTSIGEFAFIGFAAKEIHLPSTLKELGTEVFSQSTSLITVRIDAIKPPAIVISPGKYDGDIGYFFLNPKNNGLKIHVPAGSLADYKLSTNWQYEKDKEFLVEQ